MQLVQAQDEDGAVEFILSFARHYPEVARHGLALVAANLASSKLSRQANEQKLWDLTCRLKDVGLFAEVGLMLISTDG